MTIRLLLTNDHDLVRAGLVQYPWMSADKIVAGVAANVQEQVAIQENQSS